MPSVRNLPLRLKLTLVAVLTSGVALIVACGGFAIYEHFSFRKTMAGDLETITDIFDENVSGGLAFYDVDALTETLKTLREDARVVAAAVYDKSGARVASYLRDDMPADFEYPEGTSEGQRFLQDRLDTFRYVELAGDTIGVVYIGADLETIRARDLRYFLITVIVLSVGTLIAGLLAARLQRIVADPIIRLAATADSVASSRDFSLRVSKSADDEVGHLVDGFNNMLAQIEARDSQLKDARDKLERRVEERTVDLVREIAERKHAEEALARSHSVINATLESSDDGIIVLDKEGNLKHFNRRFAEIWGFDAAFLGSGQNRSIFAAVSRRLKDPRAFIRHCLGLYSDPVLESKRVIEFLDGRIVELYTRPQVSDGVSDGRVWSVRDITERKRIEAAIIYERDLLNVLLESVPDVIYFKDLESRFVRISRSKAEESLAVLREFHRARCGEDTEFPPHLVDAASLAKWLVGKTDADTFDPASAGPLLAEEQRIIRTGEPVKGKIECFRLPTGNELWYLVTKMPWRDPEGRIIGTYGISKDISEIKKAEKKLKEANDKLVVASRQAGMAVIATGVLHNVGNVLNSVNVSAGILRDTLVASEVRTLSRVSELLKKREADMDTFLTTDPKGRVVPAMIIQLAAQLEREHASLMGEQEQLVRNVEHIKGIVAMQQSYAKVSGVMEMADIPELVREALQINASGLTRLGIEVVTDFAELPQVLIDRHKVMQILVNLVTNAKHAIEEANERNGRIWASVAMRDAKSVEIKIRDNGVGIPPGNLTLIFSHGFTTRQEGHGFGLHSGALAAKEMGGSLSAESKGPGLGATFTLALPASPPKAP